ncbi:MAG: arsenosugar biosynthesis radical SAM (seleno)protein ArsS [Planctomycetota bacterium]
MISLNIIRQHGDDAFDRHLTRHGCGSLRAEKITTIQVNVGRKCNQVCRHCHIDAGPHQTEEMDRSTTNKVIELLRHQSITTLDITGGAPEINPNFRYLVEQARPHCDRIVNRCNLTILNEPGYEDLGDFLADWRVEVTASLPCYEEENVDLQRGNGVFERSIRALRQLNELGYGRNGSGLALNLVYNPIGSELAPIQSKLETSYKQVLHERYGIVFNELYAMNNVPINRFQNDLQRNGQLVAYMQKLSDAFNPNAVNGLMCRGQISIRWDGYLFDCDFNLITDLTLAGPLPRHIDDITWEAINNRTINTAPHCLACTAGSGSTCSGAISSAVLHEPSAHPKA